MPTANTPKKNAEKLTENNGKIIANEAPKAAPDEIPSENGSTIGLRNNACSTLPEIANEAPTKKVSRTRGKRMFQSMISIFEDVLNSFPAIVF